MPSGSCTVGRLSRSKPDSDLIATPTSTRMCRSCGIRCPSWDHGPAATVTLASLPSGGGLQTRRTISAAWPASVGGRPLPAAPMSSTSHPDEADRSRCWSSQRTCSGCQRAGSRPPLVMSGGLAEEVLVEDDYSACQRRNRGEDLRPEVLPGSTASKETVFCQLADGLDCVAVGRDWCDGKLERRSRIDEKPRSTHSHRQSATVREYDDLRPRRPVPAQLIES